MPLDPRELEILRSMTPARKLDVMHGLIRTGLELKEAGIRASEPELDDEGVRRKLLQILARGRR